MIWLAWLAFAALCAVWLRHRFAWAERLNALHWRLLTLADECAAVLIFGIGHALGLFSRRPMVGDTISSLCWWGNLRGVAACRWAACSIDWLFRLLVGQRDHCRKAFEWWANPLGA